MDYTATSVLSKMIKPKDSVIKLRKLKQIRRKNLEKNFLDIQLKGQDHYVFIKENGKAQVVFKNGEWIAEHIRTAILKFNYEVDQIVEDVDRLEAKINMIINKIKS